MTGHQSAGAERAQTPTTDEQGRPLPPLEANERTMLMAFLNFQRTTARMKVSGLTNDEARTPLLESSPALTCAGIIRHLTAVERAWFRLVFNGEQISDLATSDDPKAMHVSAADDVSALVDDYRRECDTADALIAKADLDAIASAEGHGEHCAGFCAT